MRSHGIYTQRGLRVSGDRCALLVVSRTQVLLHERTPLRFVLLPCSESCACANADAGFVCVVCWLWLLGVQIALKTCVKLFMGM